MSSQTLKSRRARERSRSRSLAKRTATLETASLLAADPIFYAREVLGIEKLSPDQKRFLSAAARPGARVGVHACHASGKTFGAAILLVWFLTTRAPAKVITTAAGGRTVEEQLWREARQLWAVNQSKLPAGFYPRSAKWDIAPDHFAIGFSTNDIHKFRGFHSPNLLVIADEAAGVPQEIYTAIEGLATGPEDRVVLLSNPGEAAGPFFERCKRPGWWSLGISALEQPNVIEGREVIPGHVSRDWVESRREEWGEDSPLWRMLVEGQFLEEALDALMRLSWIEEAEGRQPAPRPPVVISCDVATRVGPCETVVLTLEGETVTRLQAWVGRDTMETAGRIVQEHRRLPRSQPPIVIIDDAGVGGGVTDRLRELGIPAIAYKGALKPYYRGAGTETPDRRRERFRNLRSQSWWRLREAFRKGEIVLGPGLPLDGRLKNQLLTVTYRVASDGTVEVEPKDKMIDRGVASPDRADALVMAWHARSFPVASIEEKGRREPESLADRWAGMVGAPARLRPPSNF